MKRETERPGAWRDADGVPPSAFTVDVEEYFQVENLREVSPPHTWDTPAHRLPLIMPPLLDLLERTGTRGTFFVLGWVAARRPELVRDIAARGHEVACHGFSHMPITTQDEDTFRRETLDARARLQDLSGQPVDGYRAATFSITRASLWALRVLADAGFRYDSSVVPVRHDRYGIPDTPQQPYRWDLGDGRTLLEAPVSTLRLGSANLPVGGGGYFRLYPLALTRLALRLNLRRGLPVVFYVHPWEFDPGQPRMTVAPLRRFRHYVGIPGATDKLEALLRAVPMGTMADLVARYSAAPLVSAVP